MTVPRISVIVVNFNGKQHLESLLPTLMEQDVSAESYEVILVDNGSRDGSLRFVSTNYPRVRLLPLKNNTGFSRANNEGVRAARGEYVALLNNDTRVEKGWLRAHLEALTQSGEEVTCSSGRILDWEGEKIDFIRGILTFDGHAFQLHQGRDVKSVEEEEKSASLPFPCGGNMMISRARFLELGGFDEDFFAYLEDVDLGWRINLSGGRVVYQPEALIYHRGSATGLKLGMFKRAFLFEKNAYMVVCKNMEESLFQKLHASILFTFMHRLDRVISQEGAAHRDLMIDPYREKKQGANLKIGSDHARNHLRAYHWITNNLRRIHAKREEVQLIRSRGDSDYLEKFPLHIIPTYPGDDLLFSSPFFNSMLPEDVKFVRRALSQVIQS